LPPPICLDLQVECVASVLLFWFL